MSHLLSQDKSLIMKIRRYGYIKVIIEEYFTVLIIMGYVRIKCGMVFPEILHPIIGSFKYQIRQILHFKS